LHNWCCSLLIADVCENLALGKKVFSSTKATLDEAMRSVDGYINPYGGCVSFDLDKDKKELDLTLDLVQQHIIHVVNIYHEIVGKYVFCHLCFVS